MRRFAAAGIIASTVVMAGCVGLPRGLADGGSVGCDGTDRALCGAVAELAIAQVNLTATGPISAVALRSIDCSRAAAAHFESKLATATACWSVEVTGERSSGFGTIARFADGTLRAYW